MSFYAFWPYWLNGNFEGLWGFGMPSLRQKKFQDISYLRNIESMLAE